MFIVVYCHILIRLHASTSHSSAMWRFAVIGRETGMKANNANNGNNSSYSVCANTDAHSASRGITWVFLPS